ncbi:MAG TPA: efflux transporter outer membrane subunit [Burkholderiaceae bacterium]|jgi:NodT family efflux transporter outer membrane factor (OMF) lipoprotein
MTTFKTKPLLRLSTLFVASLLAACAHVIAPVQQPTLSGHFVGQASLEHRQSDTKPPALDSWWLGFDDAVLTGIVQRALDQNLDLAVALARVQQARAVVQESGALRLPQGSLNGQVATERQSLLSPDGELARHAPGYSRNVTLQSLGLGASWEADLAGGLKQGEAAAVAEWQAAEASRMGVRVTVVAEAADAYFRVRGAQQRIAVAEAHLQTQTQLLSLVQDRFNGGLATQREVAEAQALVLQARGTLPPLRTELAQQSHRLDVLMGEPAGTSSTQLLASQSNYRIPAIPADLAPGDLLRQRPDVIAAERQLAASQARIGVATAEYYPHLTLGGVIGSESLHGSLFSAAAFQPQAFLGLHWRLFDFGRVDAEVAQARGARAQALAEYRQRMLRATEDVEDSIVSLTQLELQRIDLVAEVDAHQVARDAAEDAYKGGAASLIEVLQEDRLLLAARDQLAQLQANNARAAVATFRAFGGGWAPVDLKADVSAEGGQQLVAASAIPR